MDGHRAWPALISVLARGEPLTADDAAWAMDQIMENKATDAQIAGFAVAPDCTGSVRCADAPRAAVQEVRESQHLAGGRGLVHPT